MTTNRLSGKVALVTGAARKNSIGRATALRLAEDGADIACLDIARPPDHAPEYGVGTPAELQDAIAEIEALGRRAIGIEADVTDWDGMHAAVRHTVSELGSLDLCCAIAGGVGFGNGITSLLRLTEIEWDWVVDLNLKGTWITARACAEAMVKAANGGRIVTIASAAALPGANGNTGMASYAAAKAGVIVLTQNFAAELGRYGITVNAVSPGMVHTQVSQPVRDRLEQKGQTEEYYKTIPLRRMADPAEMASVIAFLCSDDASYVTGAAVNATGGQTLG